MINNKKGGSPRRSLTLLRLALTATRHAPPPPLRKSSAGRNMQTPSKPGPTWLFRCAPARIAHIAAIAKKEAFPPHDHL